jgi:hypothetical protein
VGTCAVQNAALSIERRQGFATRAARMMVAQVAAQKALTEDTVTTGVERAPMPHVQQDVSGQPAHFTGDVTAQNARTVFTVAEQTGIFGPGRRLAGVHIFGQELANSDAWPAWYRDSEFRAVREASMKTRQPTHH